MITVIVTFKISSGLTADILKEKFLDTSTLYQDVTGLRRKNYITTLRIILLVVYILLIVSKMLKNGLMKIGLIG